MKIHSSRRTPEEVHLSLFLQVLHSSSLGILVLAYQELHHSGLGATLSRNMKCMFSGWVGHSKAERVSEGEEFHRTMRRSKAQGEVQYRFIDFYSSYRKGGEHGIDGLPLVPG
jgi:hypothetical protein